MKKPSMKNPAKVRVEVSGRAIGQLRKDIKSILIVNYDAKPRRGGCRDFDIDDLRENQVYQLINDLRTISLKHRPDRHIKVISIVSHNANVKIGPFKKRTPMK